MYTSKQEFSVKTLTSRFAHYIFVLIAMDAVDGHNNIGGLMYRADYWLGMHTTAFSFVSAFPCKWRLFSLRCHAKPCFFENLREILLQFWEKHRVNRDVYTFVWDSLKKLILSVPSSSRKMSSI